MRLLREVRTMGPVSAAMSLVALDDRPIDGAADPPYAHTAPASNARQKEREEKGEGTRGRRLRFKLRD